MQYVLPFIITVVIIASRFHGRDTYGAFLEGAGDGLAMIKNIFPALLCVMTASAMLRESGALELITGLIAPVANAVGMPADVIPIALIRPVSGGGSIGLLTDILNTYGADSFVGKAASVIMGSTETTLYCISVYYAKTRAKSTAKILVIALLCDAAAAVMAVWAVRLFCGV